MDEIKCQECGMFTKDFTTSKVKCRPCLNKDQRRRLLLDISRRSLTDKKERTCLKCDRKFTSINGLRRCQACLNRNDNNNLCIFSI